MNIFNRQPKIERDAVDDVLELATGENLEHHADEAATIAEGMLTEASANEDEASEKLVEAQGKYTLSISKRIAKQKLVRSVASVIERIRK